VVAANFGNARSAKRASDALSQGYGTRPAAHHVLLPRGCRRCWRHAARLPQPITCCAEIGTTAFPLFRLSTSGCGVVAADVGRNLRRVL